MRSRAEEPIIRFFEKPLGPYEKVVTDARTDLKLRLAAEHLAMTPRIGEWLETDRKTPRLLFRPDFPERKDGIIHGPDILQTIVDAVAEKLGKVTSIDWAAFHRPVRANPVAEVRREAFRKEEVLCTGRIRLKKPKMTLHFGLLNEQPSHAAVPIRKPPAPIPTAIGSRPRTVQAEVMRMGRIRSIPPARSASSRGMPRSRN